MIRCISPIDGTVYAERPTLLEDEARTAVARGKAAQIDWAARPLSERITLVQKGVAAGGSPAKPTVVRISKA